jgi:predicted MFS family arabinose efflux permease
MPVDITQHPIEKSRLRLEPIFVTIALTSFVAATYGFGIYLFSALLPEMRSALGFNYTDAGLITGAAQASFMLFAIGGGLAAGWIGGARIAFLSAVLCTVCLFAIPTVNSVLAVGFLLAIAAGTAASVYVPMVDLVSRTVPQAHRGKVLGLISSGTSYGVFINGMLVPVYLKDGNWQAIWYAVGGISLGFVVFASLIFLRTGLFSETAPPPRAKIAPVPSPKTSRFGRPETWVILIWAITFLNGFSALPFQNYLVPYLREELGTDLAFSGRIWAMIGFVGMFSGFLLGAVSDRIGIQKTMVITYAFIMISALLLIRGGGEASLLIAGVFFSLAFYPVFGLVPAYIAKMNSRLSPTIIFSVANVTLGVGGVLGNFLAGASQTYFQSFIWIYVVVAALAVLLSILALSLTAKRKA